MMVRPSGLSHLFVSSPVDICPSVCPSRLPSVRGVVEKLCHVRPSCFTVGLHGDCWWLLVTLAMCVILLRLGQFVLQRCCCQQSPRSGLKILKFIKIPSVLFVCDEEQK